MKSFQQKLMESLAENVPAQIEQPKQLAAGDEVLVDWDGETVACIVVSITDEIIKVNRVIDGETVDRDYTLSQIQSLEEPIEVEVVTEDKSDNHHLAQALYDDVIVMKWSAYQDTDDVIFYALPNDKISVDLSEIRVSDMKRFTKDVEDYLKDYNDENGTSFKFTSKVISESKESVNESAAEFRSIFMHDKTIKDFWLSDRSDSKAGLYSVALDDLPTKDVAAKVYINMLNAVKTYAASTSMHYAASIKEITTNFGNKLEKPYYAVQVYASKESKQLDKIKNQDKSIIKWINESAVDVNESSAEQVDIIDVYVNYDKTEEEFSEFVTYAVPMSIADTMSKKYKLVADDFVVISTSTEKKLFDELHQYKIGLFDTADLNILGPTASSKAIAKFNIRKEYTCGNYRSKGVHEAVNESVALTANVINVGDTVEKSFASDEADYHRKFKVVKITNGKADLIEISNGRKTSIYINDLTKINESINESVALTALVQQWDDMYGENFAKEYPEAFKKMKAKNSKTLTDIEAVWLDLYGEQFKDEYQGVYNALSKTLNESVNESISAKYKIGDNIEVLTGHPKSKMLTWKKAKVLNNNIDGNGEISISLDGRKTTWKENSTGLRLVESVNEGNERLLKSSKLSSSEYQKVKKLAGFNEDDWKWNSDDMLYVKVVKEALNEAKEVQSAIAYYNDIKKLYDKLSKSLDFDEFEKDYVALHKKHKLDNPYVSDSVKEMIQDATSKGVDAKAVNTVAKYLFDQDSVHNVLMDLGMDEDDAYDAADDVLAKCRFINESKASVSEAVVNDKESFKEYAETVMKQAHGDAYDQAIVDKMVDDIAAEVGDDWGAAVGQLTSGLGEALKALPDATSNGDGIAIRTESKDLAPKEYDALSDKDKKRYVYNKETDTWMFDSTISEAVDKEDDEAKSKEYDAGFAAGEDDTVNEEDCPYEEGTDEAKDWCEGFKAGSKK